MVLGLSLWFTIPSSPNEPRTLQEWLDLVDKEKHGAGYKYMHEVSVCFVCGCSDGAAAAVLTSPPPPASPLPHLPNKLMPPATVKSKINAFLTELTRICTVQSIIID